MVNLFMRNLKKKNSSSLLLLIPSGEEHWFRYETNCEQVISVSFTFLALRQSYPYLLVRLKVEF